MLRLSGTRNLVKLMIRILALLLFFISNPAHASDGTGSPGYDVENFINGLVGKTAIIHLRNKYYSGPVPGQFKPHYGVMKQMERDGILEATNSQGRWSFFVAANYFQETFFRSEGDWLSLKLGTYDVLKIVNLGPGNSPDCEWTARVRAWLKNETIVYQKVQAKTGFDGYIHDLCFYYGRDGLVWKYNTWVSR